MIDAFVFGLLEDMGMFDSCRNACDIALKLRISQRRADSIMLQSALLRTEDGKSIIDENRILEAFASHARHMSSDYISFEIDDSRIRLALKLRCQKHGILTDTSFNSSIFRVQLKDFITLLNTFVPKGREEALKKALKQELSTVSKQVKFKKLWSGPLAQSLIRILEGVCTSMVTNGCTSIQVLNTMIVTIQNICIK